MIGVLLANRDGNELSNFIAEMQYSNQEVFMINNNSTVVAHKDHNLVMEMYNIFNDYETNPELEGLYKLAKNMTEGLIGVGEYTFNGMTKYMGYYPVEGTNWSLAVTAPKSVVLTKIADLTQSMMIVSVVFILIGIVLTILIAGNITQPIKKSSKSW